MLVTTAETGYKNIVGSKNVLIKVKIDIGTETGMFLQLVSTGM